MLVPKRDFSAVSLELAPRISVRVGIGLADILQSTSEGGLCLPIILLVLLDVAREVIPQVFLGMLGEEDLEGRETAEATIQSGSGQCFI